MRGLPAVVYLVVCATVSAAGSTVEILQALRSADYVRAAELARRDLERAGPDPQAVRTARWGLGRALYEEARLQAKAHGVVPELAGEYLEKALGSEAPDAKALRRRLGRLTPDLPPPEAVGPELVLRLADGSRAVLPDPLAPGSRAARLHAEAARVLETVAEEWPRARERALLLAGRSRLALGQLEPAIRDLQAAGSPEAAGDLLEALTGAGRMDEAAGRATRLAAGASAEACWRHRAARLRRGLLTPAAALARLKAEGDGITGLEARLAAAEVARRAGDAALELELLEAAYDHAGRDDPSRNPPILILTRALALYRRGIGSYPEATASLLVLAERFPELGVLHRSLQGIYAASVRRGGDQRLEDGT